MTHAAPPGVTPSFSKPAVTLAEYSVMRAKKDVDKTDDESNPFIQTA
jgi:hypothetical protein